MKMLTAFMVVAFVCQLFSLQSKATSRIIIDHLPSLSAVRDHRVVETTIIHTNDAGKAVSEVRRLHRADNGASL